MAASPPDNKCPFCGEEASLRYLDWSDEVCGLYCETCDKSLDFDETEWQDGPIGSEYPWYGTGDWNEDWEEVDD